MFRSKEDKKLIQNKLRKFEAVILLIALVIAGFGIWQLGPSLTGFVIKQFSYSEDLNLVVTSNGNYTWNPANIGDLKSLKMDGKVTNSGTAKVYIESNGIKYLIFDSTRLNESAEILLSNETSLITGFSVKDEDKNKDEDKGKDDEKDKDNDKDKKKKNHKPEWDGPNSFTINGTAELNLSQYFTDKDDDSLTFSASSDSDKLSVSVNNGVLTLTPNSNNNFNTTLTLTASDGIDSTSEIARIIAVIEKETIQENHAPVWNSDADSFVINGTTIIDLSQYFTDEDNDNLSYNYGSVANITISLDSSLMALVPADDYYGSAFTIFTAFDGKNLTIKSVTLTVPFESVENATTPSNETSKINHAPEWNSDADSFVLNKTLSIDLSQYFIDEDNDSLLFSASDADNASETVSGNILSLSTNDDNVNTTITLAASDSKLITNKNVKLIIPLTALTSIVNETINQTPVNETTNTTINETAQKTIAVNLSYNSGTVYDANDNGEESITGVVDLSAANTKLNWNADESKLCTRWEIYNTLDATLNTFCNGNSDCCAFVGVLPTKSNWSEIYYSTLGKDGAGYDNIVSAQVLYYDVDLSVPKSEIYNSGWGNLSVKFYNDETEFLDRCIDTCYLNGLNKSSYTLIFEIEGGATLRIDRLKYDVLIDIGNNPPVLLQNISRINISANRNATINLSNYFADADGDSLNYNYYKSDNLTIAFENNIATIVPDRGIEGVKYTYITANDSELTAVSDVFMVNISKGEFKPKVEIGKPVKWISTILVDVRNSNSINLSLPDFASNVTITVMNASVQQAVSNDKLKIVENGKTKNKELFEAEKRLEKINRKISILEEARQNDALSVEVDDRKFDFKDIDSKLDELYAQKSNLESQLGQISGNSVTGNAVSLITGNVVALTDTVINQTQSTLVINESWAQNTEIQIEYETEAPISIEDEINQYTKEIKIVSDTHYDDILAYTTLNDVPQSAIKLYWIQNNSRTLFDNINYLDENNNGLIDRIEWTVPHLSNQTFEVSVTVLNVQSYPTVGGNWTVAFNTSGTGNLNIFAYNGTTYSEVPEDSSTINDLEYLETRCGNIVVNTTIVCANGEEMPYEVYKIKKRIAEIKKRLNELNQTG